MTDYSVEDAKNVLGELKNNPYGITPLPHFYKRSQKRSIDEGTVTLKLSIEIPLNIRKISNYSNRFELIYKYDNSKDLYIFIDIENNDRVSLVTSYFDKHKRG